LKAFLRHEIGKSKMEIGNSKFGPAGDYTLSGI
jgi:hypothetical protein